MAVIPVGSPDPKANQASSREDLFSPVKDMRTQNAPRTKSASAAFAVDLGAENALANAYGARTKGVSDVLMGGVREQDMTASRNMDIVLSHTLSPADYRKAQEDGFDPSEIEASETTTIVDHIKASLLQSGTSVAGVTDDLSAEQLAQITGSEAYAQELVRAFHENDIPLTKDNIYAVHDAVTRAAALPALSEESMLYLVENELTPGVDNLYLAAHAARGRADMSGGFFAGEDGYQAKAGSGADLAQLQPQIDRVIAEAGLNPTDEVVQKEAGDLIGAGITLTKEHLLASHELHALTLPPSRETVVKAAAQAIADGESALKGNLVRPESLLRQALTIQEKTDAVSEEALRQALAEGEKDAPLTLKGLFDAQDQLPAHTQTPVYRPVDAYIEKPSQDVQDTRLAEARLQLEEVRLSMSVTANLTLLRTGFAIDTAPMEQLIDALRGAITQQAKDLFAGADDAALSRVSVSYRASASFTMTNASAAYRLYAETNIKAEYLRTEMPLGVLGAVKDEFATDTLDDIFSKATTWKLANSAYETMQTEVRRDLGDSFEKAFGNADALLNEIGMEATKEHLRAVRILGYNRMEISYENVTQVRDIDAKLDQLLADLKPAAVLDLIRSGKNPLAMTLDELSAQLRERNAQAPAGDDKYARFLYKLEQSGQITGAEKSSYIGIYRMFETLQRTDHAAIGTLLSTGAEMSIKNLLTATRTVRTAQGAGVTLSADDGAVTKGRITNAIETQIDAAFSYYRAEAEKAFRYLAPEKLQRMEQPEEMLLPDFAARMEELPADTQTDRAFEAEEAARMRETLQGGAHAAAREEAAKALEESEIPLTASNLEAMQALRASGRRQSASTLWESANEISDDTETTDVFRAEARTLLDTMGETEDYALDYRQGIERMQAQLQDQMLLNNTAYPAYRAMELMHRELGVAAQMADRGSFEVPLTAGGRTVSMSVRLVADRGQGSGVSITIDTEEYGTVSGKLQVREQRVKATLSTTYGATPQVRSFMEGVWNRFGEGVAAQTGLEFDITSQAILYNVRPSQIGAETGGSGTGSRQLFRLAKLFTETVAL